MPFLPPAFSRFSELERCSNRPALKLLACLKSLSSGNASSPISTPHRRMVTDLEKAEQEGNQNVPQHVDGPILHPEVSTTRDGESRKEADERSVHSQSSGDSIEPVPVQQETPTSSNPKPASVGSRTLSIVPSSKRRGLLGRLSIIPEVDRPYDYANTTKWLITLVVALAAAAAPLGSAIFFREYFAPN
jgi:hypothetical protein